MVAINYQWLREVATALSDAAFINTHGGNPDIPVITAAMVDLAEPTLDAKYAKVPASDGTTVLVGGTVTVADTSITATSLISVQHETLGGTPGALFISAKVVGTSFDISSTSALDTSTVAYQVIAY